MSDSKGETMPYDARKTSVGGNRGIDERFTREAPKGKFRLVGVDTFDGTDWLVDDFKTLNAAMRRAKKETAGKDMLKMHVYDDTGNHQYESGSF